jgi:RNA polymerase primary sigma factor
LKITKQITNRESQSLDKYFQEIGKVDLITPEEEIELAIKIREGDKKALRQAYKSKSKICGKCC